MYVAVKGGERAILNSYRMLDDYRRGDREVPELSLAQIREQMPLAVSRVMSEGSLYDPQLAALALKQAAGDAIEAVFLLRAYRTTLSRFGYTQPLDTGRMRLQRRISSTFRTCRAARSWGRPTITPSACWIFRWKPGARPMPCRRARKRWTRPCRASPTCWRTRT